MLGAATVLFLSCTQVKEPAHDQLIGYWESTAAGPDLMIFREGDAYKITVFKHSGITRKLKPETFLLKEEAGNLFISTGFRIDLAYNEGTGILTVSSHGDYARSVSKH